MLLPDPTQSIKQASPALTGQEADAPPATAMVDPSQPGGWMRSWAFRLVMLRHHRAVYRLAMGIVRNPREAEDVCQEVFARYWCHAAGVEQPKVWLLRVARNEALTRLRRMQRWQTQEMTAAHEPMDEDDPERQLQRQLSAEHLHRAIDSLPEPQRSLVLLFDLQGLDGASCASILDLNVNQVKVYLHRARKRLREQLEHAL